MTSEAYIYEAIRTPRGRGKANGSLHGVKPVTLVTGLIDELRTRHPGMDTNAIDDLVLGCVTPVGDQGADRLVDLETAAREADARYHAAAARLSAARAKAAEKLNKAVNTELAPLKLERAKFMTQVDADPDAAGPQGIDRVEFWVQTNPGTRPGPMMKVASGGELSRFLLALKVVLSDRGSAPTLVFDEIDTGVGGAVADAIGARLARLAGKVQVMAVTHAPQVAARADQHLLISKAARDKGRRVATRVNALADDHRREEIARMLAGAEITAEARAAADRLIKAAG